MDRIRVLVPDGEWEVLTNHVKDCLSFQEGVQLFILSNRKFQPSRYSRFVSRYLCVSGTVEEADWIAQINEIVRHYGIDIIMPVYEKGIRSLIRHRTLLWDPEKLVPLPELTAFDIATDKRQLSRFLREHGIPAPEEVSVERGKDLGLEAAAFPILAKPLHITEGGRGIQYLANAQAFQDFLNTVPEGESYLFQKYIKGYDIDCSVLCLNGVIKAFAIQKGELYGSSPYAPAIGLRFVHDTAVHEVVQALMQRLNWSGVAHIDLRYDEETQQVKVIEVNARFWTTMDGALKAGVNFPQLFLFMAMKREFEPPVYEPIQFLSFNGIVRRLRSGGVKGLSLTFLRNNTSVLLLLRDPLPVLAKGLMSLKNRTIRLFRSRSG